MAGFERFTLFAAAGGLALGGPAALAQEASDQVILSEVVVTAQKRAQRLEDVPMAVSALPAQELLDRNQPKIEDYFQSVPGLSLSPLASGRYNLSIRGVTTGISTSPTVGVTIDDVPYGSVSILGFGSRFFPNLDPSDLQRIEVLRGPQGTLYGASSLGGLLKYVTTDPSLSGVFGRVQADTSQISNGGLGGSVRGAVNIPLIDDQLAIRISGLARHDGGYVDDPAQGRKDVDRANVYGGRIALLWNIAPGVRLKLSALNQREQGDGTNQIATDYRLNDTIGDLDQDALIGTGAYSNHTQFYTASLSADLGSNIGLDVITGYSINDYATIADPSPSYGAYVEYAYPGTDAAAMPYAFRTQKFSQEIRLSRTGTTLDWLVGGFFTREDSKDYFTANAAIRATGDYAGVLFDEHDQFRYDEYAVFGDVTVHVSPRFDVQTGGRFGHNTQKYHSLTAIPAPAEILLGSTTDFRQDSSDSAFTYQVSPSFKLAPELLIYGRLSTGYRPGGPNAGDFNASTPRTFRSDRTTNYELGLKGTVLDKRLSFDLAAYTLDWKDIQLAFHDETTGFLFLRNASKAVSRGVEGSFEFRPVKTLLISGNASFNNANLASDLPAEGSYGRDGDVLPNVPQFSGSLTVEQSIPLTGSLEGFVGGSVNYVGHRLGEFPNSSAEVRLPMSAYTKGDLRLGVRNDQMTVTAFINNVGDTRAQLYAGTLGSSSFTTSPFYKLVAQPRTVGVSVAYNF